MTPGRRAAGIAETSRFAAVSVAGLVLDVGVASALTLAFGVPLILSAIIGFTVGLCFNYVVHLLWTFVQAGQRASIRHFAGYATVVLVTLAVRILALSVWRALVPPSLQHPTIQLIGAAGISFLLGFILLRATVFRRRA